MALEASTGEDRIGHLSRQRHILSHGEYTHERSVHGEVHLDTDAGVGVEGLQPPDEGQLLLREEVILKGPCCEGTISKKGLDSVTSELIFRTTAELSALYASGVKDSTDWSR